MVLKLKPVAKRNSPVKPGYLKVINLILIIPFMVINKD